MRGELTCRPQLTDRQHCVLRAVREYVARHGYAPTVRELVALTGFSSTSVVTWHLDKLQEKGYLTRAKDKARTIRLLGEASCEES